MEPICWNIKKIISKGDYNYALVKEHPYATKQGYVLEHRVVMENHLGRLLDKTEIVHHINGNKKDNRVSNLEVMDVRTHNRLHAPGRLICHVKCPGCNVEFCREHHNTHLGKRSGSATYCSRKCKGSIGRKVQLGLETQIVEVAISENILSIFRRTTPR